MPVKNTEVKTLGIKVSAPQYEWLLAYSKRRTLSISAAVRLIIDDYRNPDNYMREIGRLGCRPRKIKEGINGTINGTIINSTDATQVSDILS